MADVFSKEKRSEVMSKIKGSNTKIENQVRKWLYAHGLRYRKNDKRFPGKPDIVLTKQKIAIFANGCFWHAHSDCKYAYTPKTRTEFWTEKIKGNVERDRRNEEQLKKMGFTVLIVWECELKYRREETLEALLEKIIRLNE